MTELNQYFRRINLSPGCKMTSGREGGLSLRYENVVLQAGGSESQSIYCGDAILTPSD